MPTHGGRDGGSGSGGTLASEIPGTFTATASTSGVATFLIGPGFLTELNIRVDGDINGTITGGPVRIEAWLKRGPYARKLCSGAIQNEFTIRGSGQLPIVTASEVLIKWTELSGTGVIVRVDAFVDTSATGDSAPGWFDETPRVKYIFQARRVNTQTNGAGGQLTSRFSVPAGVVARLLQLYGKGSASAGATLALRILDEDAADSVLAALTTAGANAEISLPSIGTAATAPTNRCDSQSLTLVPGQFAALTSNAALQTETLTIFIVLELNEPVAPTWDTTGSAGTPSLAASTISAANTWQVVRA